MKKRYSRIFSALAAMAVCFNTSASVNAAVSDNVQPSAITVTAEDNAASFTSDEEMLKYVRNQMKQRIESFSVVRKGVNVVEASDYRDMFLTKIFDYTGDPKEGSYLFLGVRHISATTDVEDDILKIDFELSYMTTYDQEAELDTQINNIVSAMPFILGDNYQNLTDAEKVAKGYDYFVKLMKNVEHIEDKRDPSLYSAYSVLVNKKANSIGFVQLFIRTLAEIGIESNVMLTQIDLTGKLGAHFLPAVCVDGTYYLCDPVSDFILGDGDNKFLLKGVKDFDSALGSSSGYKEAVEKYGLTLNKLAEQNGVALYSYDKKFEFGDVSDDGIIDSADASMILAEYARRSSSSVNSTFSAGQNKAGDINKDGHVDSLDASVVLSYYAYASTTSGTVKSIDEFIKNK